MAISLIRIDDRMIHGQVVMSWIRHTGSQAIRLIDDRVAADPVMKEIMLAAAPDHLDVDIVTQDQAGTDFQGWKDTEKKFMIIVRTPQTLVNLLEKGVPMETVNLGGLGMAPGKKKIYRNIAASAEERTALSTLLDEGINIYIQMISTERRIELTQKTLND
jgi:mannose/fructose/N-acetylgalactosamine-specific phosphotransferase system component IIB